MKLNKTRDTEVPTQTIMTINSIILDTLLLPSLLQWLLHMSHVAWEKLSSSLIFLSHHRKLASQCHPYNSFDAIPAEFFFLFYRTLSWLKFMNSNRRPYFGAQLLIIHCGKMIGHLQIIRKISHGFGFLSNLSKQDLKVSQGKQVVSAYWCLLLNQFFKWFCLDQPKFHCWLQTEVQNHMQL